MLQTGPLGKKTPYVETYAPDLLFPIPRTMARDQLGLKSSSLPFQGVDIWTGFELSWLNENGKPEIALAEFRFPCSSPYIVESKSFKLYLNSFNQSTYATMEAVRKVLQKDLTHAAGENVDVELYSLRKAKAQTLAPFAGLCLDDLDIVTDTYEVEKNFLQTSGDNVEETLYSNLLKSNCLATGQPDWGTVLIRYAGKKIDRKGLLKYIISFRRHSGFAEHCVEQIFQDVLAKCRPERLTVYARYTRRGGLDINPYRSNFEEAGVNDRQLRQ